MIVTSSRDKSIIVWRHTKEDKTYGVAQRRLTGHSHFVQDGVLSSNGHFAQSGSWDDELRLWDLNARTTARRFVGHTKDVLSVAFSIDNRQFVLESRDKSIKLWNTLGECKYTTKTATLTLKSTLVGHGGYVNTVAMSPDGSLCASGGKDGVILLWDLAEGKRLYSLDASSIVHALCFSPNRYWLCAATESSITIWDLESKTIVLDLKVDLKQESEMAAEGTTTQTNAGKTKILCEEYDREEQERSSNIRKLNRKPQSRTKTKLKTPVYVYTYKILEADLQQVAMVMGLT
ncbi:hypothetical protein Lser_V15G09725 [Lactuca serriola]